MGHSQNRFSLGSMSSMLTASYNAPSSDREPYREGKLQVFWAEGSGGVEDLMKIQNLDPRAAE